MKRIIRIFVVVAILIGGSGCMLFGKESRTEKMMKHLNAKYDDAFSDPSPYGGGMGPSNTTEIHVKSKKYPDARVWASYTVNEDESVTYSDNYVTVKYEAETRAALQKVMEEVIGDDGEVLTFYSLALRGTENSFDDNTTLSEFMKSSDADIGFTSVVRKGYKLDKKTFEKRLQKTFSDANITVSSGKIYFAETDEQFEDINKVPSRVASKLQRLLFSTYENELYSAKWRI